MRDVRLAALVGAMALVAVAAAPLAAQQPQAAAKKPPAMKHTAEGRANCMMCHTGRMPNVPGVPADHADRPNETCLWCHAADAAVLTKTAPAIPHTLQGRTNCTMCHSGKMPNVPAMPADHAGRDAKYCMLCHTAPAS